MDASFKKLGLKIQFFGPLEPYPALEDRIKKLSTQHVPLDWLCSTPGSDRNEL